MNLLFCFLIFILATNGSQAKASITQGFTLDGQLTKSDGSSPLLDSQVQVRAQILNFSQDCILYEQTQTIDTSASNGYFNIAIGSPLNDSHRSVGDSGNTMSQVYRNIAPINGKNVTNGALCTVTPLSNESRYLKISLRGSDGVQNDLSPNILLHSVPYALIAEDT